MLAVLAADLVELSWDMSSSLVAPLARSPDGSPSRPLMRV